MTTSQASIALFSRMNGSRLSEPISSSPSIRNFTLTGQRSSVGLPGGPPGVDVNDDLTLVVRRARGRRSCLLAHRRLERRECSTARSDPRAARRSGRRPGSSARPARRATRRRRSGAGSVECDLGPGAAGRLQPVATHSPQRGGRPCAFDDSVLTDGMESNSSSCFQVVAGGSSRCVEIELTTASWPTVPP